MSEAVTAPEQDPDWKFNAKPPGWMIGLLFLWVLGINLASWGIIGLVEWALDIDPWIFE